jgi:hypothetical protein
MSEQIEKQEEEGSDPFELLNEIILLAKDAKQDVERTIKGNKSAAQRVRARLMDVRNIASEIKAWTIQEIANNGIVYLPNNAKAKNASKKSNIKRKKNHDV